VGQADVEESREVVEALPEAGREAAQPELQLAQEEPQQNEGWLCHRPSCRWRRQQLRRQPHPRSQPRLQSILPSTTPF
jgi:hypothetical protein